MATTREEWVRAYAEKIGVEPPTTEQVNEVLDLAAAAAHGSEKTAAPLACWLAGISGRPLAELLRAAEELE
jgi:hypothetical protein